MQIIYSTLPNIEIARKIATEVIRHKLAACVNILPHVESIYGWQGAIETSNEVVIICKTTQNNSSALIKMIAAKHPYDTPSIFALNSTETNSKFEEWINSTLK